MYGNREQVYYADFFKRVLAYLIDGIILWGAGFVLSVIAGALSISYYLVSLAASWLYFSYMESSAKQATLGKQLLQIAVTDLNGNRLSFGAASLRYFSKLLSMITVVGFIMPAFTEQKQGLHDRLAGTLVLRAGFVPTHAYERSAAPPTVTDMSGNKHGGAVPAAVRPFLIGLTGEFSGVSFPVDGGEIALGRDPDHCQIIFTRHTAGISRKHCIVRFNAASRSFVVTDAGSSYGTFLDSGARLQPGQAFELVDGGRFYVGDRGNLFEVKG
ncbi:MAG: hypothetical protein K0R57_4960 [Paenibacillaceae bacterium]|nr:hypothetical protein [Paenibacillaceae bacterium]